MDDVDTVFALIVWQRPVDHLADATEGRSFWKAIRRFQHGHRVVQIQKIGLRQRYRVVNRELVDVAKHSQTKVVIDAAVGECLRLEIPLVRSNIPGAEFQWRKESREGRRCSNGHGNGRKPNIDSLEIVSLAAGATLKQQSVAVERTEATLAEVGRHDVQLRSAGQFVERRIAIQITLVMLLQQTGSRQAAPRPHACESHQRIGRTRQRKPAHDPIPHVKLDETYDRIGDVLKFIFRTAVLVPVLYEMSAENAAA